MFYLYEVFLRNEGETEGGRKLNYSINQNKTHKFVQLNYYHISFMSLIS